MKRDIQGYKPAPGDLAYPDKLIVASSMGRQDSAQPTHSDSDSVFNNSGNEVHTYSTYLHYTLVTLWIIYT